MLKMHYYRPLESNRASSSQADDMAPDRFRPIHTVTFPKIDEIFFYIGRCRFMKTDRKPRVKIVRIYTHHNPPATSVALLASH
jgi:hypothetical protein